MFSGCAADREFQERIVHEIARTRADIINMDLPISYEGLNIFQARAKGNIIYISADIEDGHSFNEALINNAVYNQCQNREFKKVLESGIEYHLSIVNSKKQKNMTINEDTCNAIEN